jgi:alpha-tubulin suppressor-like RCC1 family protein
MTAAMRCRVLILVATSGCGGGRASPPEAPLAEPRASSSATPPTTPASPPVVELAAGTRSTMARLASGAVMVWGGASTASITGDGKSMHTTPVEVPAARGFVQIAIGDDYACGLTDKGRVRCWGRDPYGNDSTVPQDPGQDEGSIGQEVRLSGGRACESDGVGDLWCWARLDTVKGVRPSTSSIPAPNTGSVRQIVPAFHRVCFVNASATLGCHGVAFGRRTAEIQDFPFLFFRDLPGVKQASQSDSHLCAVVASGAIYCVGFGDRGELGNGRHTGACASGDEATPCYAETSPVKVVDLPDVEQVATGDAFSCARTQHGHVYCWGDNDSGQLGLGDTEQRDRPLPVPGLTDATQIVAGDSHACALRRDGGVLCWGANASGQLGTGDQLKRLSPTPVVTTVASIANIWRVPNQRLLAPSHQIM